MFRRIQRSLHELIRFDSFGDLLESRMTVPPTDEKASYEFSSMRLFYGPSQKLPHNH